MKMMKGTRGKLFYRFVRTHVTTRMVQAGWQPEDARDLVDGVSDAEIDRYAKEKKIGALSDNGFLAWLINHGPQILAFIEFMFKLLALFGVKAAEDVKPEDKEDE